MPDSYAAQAFGEPVVDGLEEVAGFGTLARLDPQSLLQQLDKDAKALLEALA